MIIGIPKEIMKHEGRVGITPEGVRVLTKAGHKVMVQSQAGKATGFDDEDFSRAGAHIKENPQHIYRADLVIKVKEPQESEYSLLKEDGIIFAFLHLPANSKLVKALKEKGIAGIAYEGIQLEGGERPILRPMSEIAGEIAVREGTKYLKKETESAKVVVLGAAGIVGQAAVKTAKSLGASVIALDLAEKLPSLQSNEYRAEISTPENIQKALREADLLVGAAANPGGRTTKLVSREMIASMKPGSVIADVAIDEGGCIETSRPTDHDNPVFIEEGIIHYCVKNIPGIVPKTSTPALTTVTLPYIIEIANKGLEKAMKDNPALAKGAHVYKGKITNPDLAEIFDEEYTPLEMLINKA